MLQAQSKIGHCARTPASATKPPVNFCVVHEFAAPAPCAWGRFGDDRNEDVFFFGRG